MRLDINVTDLSKNLYDLKNIVLNACWFYIRSRKNFELYPMVFLNRSAFSFEVSVYKVILTFNSVAVQMNDANI